MLKFKQCVRKGAWLEFFAIASPEVRDRLDMWLRRSATESDARSQLLDELQACTPEYFPAFMRALALRPKADPASRRVLEDAINRYAAGIASDNASTIDAGWTWLEAWLAHCDTPNEFVAPFSAQPVRDAFRSSFLLTELARITTVSPRPNTTALFLAPAISQLGAVQLTGADAITYGVAIARLIYGAALHAVTSPVALALTDACLTAGAEAFAAFRTEVDVCEFIDEQRVRGEASWASLAPRQIATALALEELRQSTPGQHTDEGWSEPAEARYRRVHALVGRAIQGAPLEECSRILFAISSDNDLFLRCAAIRHAFATTTSFGSLSKQSAHDLREAVRACVLGARSQGEHHWLNAAIISAHCDAATARNSRPVDARWAAPSIGTFDLPQELLTSDVDRPPGLSAQVKRFKSHYKCVALVLPSIEGNLATTTDTERRQANKGSPPLGLGGIASHVSSLGHFVRLYDAHRYSYDQERLSIELATFDVVGVSVVFSSIRSAAALITAIRRHGHQIAPKVVVGGHAPTLMTAHRIEAAGIDFDYLVIGPGEEAFDYILSEINAQQDTRPRIVSGTISVPLSEARFSNNRELARARSSTSSQYQHFIEHLAWMDRAVFVNAATGVAYEPTTTRNGKDVEAHLVLSRGCDWRCSFCTEALIAGKHGENRRSVPDVIGEIEHLVRHHRVNRIQFIDDNVFPTLPTYKRRNEVHEAKASAWTQDLLASLRRAAADNSGQPTLKWRGLMRAEDFLRYETLIPHFVECLAASGCNLLAFGFECGNERARAKMKGGEECASTNAELTGLVSRLQAVRVFVKGYFIIGGPDQTKADIEETIKFAVSSNLDLAYFAIYKDFRGIAQMDDNSTNSDAAALRFQLFSTDLLDSATKDLDDQQWEQRFGAGIPHEKRIAHVTALKSLHSIGFSFKDIVRYNDYHEWVEPYAKMGFVDHKDYFKALCEAYLRFYARREWVARYRDLVRSGY